MTPLVRAERASAAAEERLKHSLDAGQMGTFEVDLDQEEIVFDRQEAKLLGLPDDMHRLSLADFNRMLIAPDTTPFEARIAKSNGRFADELHLRLPDSSEHWLSFAAAPQRLGKADCGRYIGLSYDVTERKANEDRVRLLLAAKCGIARRTCLRLFSPSRARQRDKRTRRPLRTSLAIGLPRSVPRLIFSGAVTGRGWTFMTLSRRSSNHLPEQEIGSRFAGPSVMVRPEAAQTLGMALHELMTNALKYGALSIPEGRVSVEWRSASDVPDHEFSLVWSEAGGPEVKPISHRGFGYSVLMEQTAWALNGKVEAQYQSTGLIWKLWAPLQEIAAALSRH